MHALLLAAALGPSPAIAGFSDIVPLIEMQHEIALHDIRIGIQADLERRGARFFADDGDLHQLLDDVIIVNGELAAR